MNLAGALGALALLLPAAALADRFEHGLTAAVASEYDSNPALSATSTTGVWRYSLLPGYSLNRVAGADTWNARLGLRLERSSDADLSIGREDPNLSLAWTRQTPTGSFGVSAGYEETSTRVAELQDSGLVAADGSKIGNTFSANWNQALDERDTLSFNLSRAGVSYRGGNLSDYATLSAGATWNRTRDERTSHYLRFSASRYTPDNRGSDSDSFDFLAGWRLSHSERLNLDLSAGMNRTVAQTAKNGWQGSAKLNYALDERSAVSFDLGRSVASSGVGGFVESDVLNANWNRALSDKQSIGASLSKRRSQAAATGDTTQLNLFASRALGEAWSLRASYLYKQVQGSGVAEASGHVLSLTLSYANPNFLDF